MILKDLVIQENDFDVFVALNPTEKIEFLWDAMHIGTEKSVDKQVSKLEQLGEGGGKTVLMSIQDLRVGPYTLSIMTIDRIVVFTSENLRLIRSFVKHMWYTGYILHRRPDIRKTPHAVMPKYFIAYEMIGEEQPMCEN